MIKGNENKNFIERALMSLIGKSLISVQKNSTRAVQVKELYDLRTQLFYSSILMFPISRTGAKDKFVTFIGFLFILNIYTKMNGPVIELSRQKSLRLVPCDISRSTF